MYDQTVTLSWATTASLHNFIMGCGAKFICPYFVFPEKELPAPMPSAFDTLKGEPVPMEQFMALTKIPILIIYGDNIPDKPVAMPAQDSWRVRLAMARKWRDVVNKHGGDVTVTHLPEVGIKGNTHFPFTDLNNVQIADLVSRFLKEKNLQ
ncbi:hypothetical protein H001_00859 [Escherichia coli UMEA 3955-1]|nr:hypothetical protein H001_00859 [Escherichia coli UMEA 3955-1]